MLTDKAIVEENPDLLKRYFHNDVLLLDALTCLREKYSTQQEVLFYLRQLREQGIQVMLTALPDLEQSMRILYHRFSGTVLEIKKPADRTAKRIIAYHARKRGVSLKEHQIEKIVETSSGNGFLIEGAITRQHFYEHVAL